MFHLKLKPSPPEDTGFVIIGQAVDSSAIMSISGNSAKTAVFSFWKNAMASKF